MERYTVFIGQSLNMAKMSIFPKQNPSRLLMVEIDITKITWKAKIVKTT